MLRRLLNDEDFDVDVGRGRGGSSKKRYGGGGGGRGKRKKPRDGSRFFELEADQVDSDEEEEEDEAEDGFIIDIPNEDSRRMHRRPLPLREDEQEDVEALERSIQARYARSTHSEYEEETTEVEQQALLPSVRDPKLWMVKCAIGRERQTAACLMQKYIDKRSDLRIRSVIALDHLKNYIYVEADKKAHVREAIRGLWNLFGAKITLVPIREMTGVLSVESKAIDRSRDTWVRMKIGTYKGDLAQVDNRKKGRFMKGDAVIVIKGDLKNLKRWVEKVEEKNVHIRPQMKGLPKTLAVNEKELCKYFEPGNHVKVVGGIKEGETGMVVKVEQHVLVMLSDTTKQHIHVFIHDVVQTL